MRCQQCDSAKTIVVDSRSSDDAYRRRRECTKCGRRYTTYERIVEEPILVSGEPYDHQRFYNSVCRACGGAERAIAVWPLCEESIALLLHDRMELDKAEIAKAVIRILGKFQLVACVRYRVAVEKVQTIVDILEIVWDVGHNKE